MKKLLNANIVLITADEEIIKEFQKILGAIKGIEITVSSNSEESITEIIEMNPEVILLDLQMSGIDDFELTEYLENIPGLPPVIMFTKKFDKLAYNIHQPLAADFLQWPVFPAELIARVKTQIGFKRMRDELNMANALLNDREMHMHHLEKRDQTEIGKITLALLSSLESGSHDINPDVRNHIHRVCKYSGLLAERYGCTPEFVRKIKLYAAFHDVGIAGIDPRILLKPAPLTPNEFKLMQEHVMIGYKMLASESVGSMACNIALYHHEKWNGKGYIHQKAGYDIPLEARIVALADVYDALSFQRVYKDAFSEDRTKELIFNAKGTHFEPKLVNLLYQDIDEFMEMKQQISR